MNYRTRLYPHMYPRKGLDAGRILLSSVEQRDGEKLILAGATKQKRTSVEVR